MIPLAEVTETIADFLHVVTNHVNAIQTIVATIQDSEFRTPQAVATHQKLRSRIEGLAKACGAIRNASEAQGGGRVDVNKCAKEVIGDFEETFSPSIERRFELSPDMFISGSSTQIESIIRHVVRNALEATPEGGSVTLRTRTKEEAERIIVEIQDTGPGMSRETLQRCKRPFFTTKQGRGGSGLGLWISTQILHRVGGDMEIDSELGQGTTVRISLPGSLT